MIHGKRFLQYQVAVNPAFGGDGPDIRHTGQKNKRRFPVPLHRPYPAMKLETVHQGHGDIGQNDVDVLTAQNLQALHAVPRDGDLMPDTADDVLQHLQILRFIFYSKDLHRAFLPGIPPGGAL